MKKKVFVITFILLALSALLLYIRIERKPQSSQKSTVSSIHASQDTKKTAERNSSGGSDQKQKAKTLSTKYLVGKTFFNDADKIEFISAHQYIISEAKSEGNGSMEVAYRYKINGKQITITNPGGEKEQYYFSFSAHKVTIGEATYTDQPNTKYWDKNGKDISKASKKNYNEPDVDDEESDQTESKPSKKTTVKKSSNKTKADSSDTEKKDSSSSSNGKENQKNESKTSNKKDNS
jgi:hypothetical protein